MKGKRQCIFWSWDFFGFFIQKLLCPLTWVYILSSASFQTHSLPSGQLTQQIKGWLAQGAFLTLPCFRKWCLSGGIKASPWAWKTQVLSPGPRYFYVGDIRNAKSAFSSCMLSASTNILRLRPGLHREAKPALIELAWAMPFYMCWSVTF